MVHVFEGINSCDLCAILITILCFSTIFYYIKSKINKFKKVRNFRYNGFSCKLLEGYLMYKAQVKEQTEDPNIVKCICSDGKERDIPILAIM